MSLSRPGSPGAQSTSDSVVGSFDERERKSIDHVSSSKTLNSLEEPEAGTASEELRSTDIMRDRAPPRSVTGKLWVYVDRVAFSGLICRLSGIILLCRFEGHEVLSINSVRKRGNRIRVGSSFGALSIDDSVSIDESDDELVATSDEFWGLELQLYVSIMV